MTDLFSYNIPAYKITKPIRLIELFGGVGTQAMALRNLGADFEHYKLVEFDKYACASYNAIHGTKFETQDIMKTTAKDLEIVDTDKYEYLMTYSFPCTDLSVAGLTMGMEEGSGTRSSLLWEVKRILQECKELSAKDSRYGLPKILQMENVIQVHSEDNRPSFQKWLLFLESLGYKNFYEDLEASQYGIAQHRDRCFCISILEEDCNYTFPEPITLTTCIKDYLEPTVAEKFYINNEAADRLINNLIERGELADRDGSFRKNLQEDTVEEYVEEESMFDSF